MNHSTPVIKSQAAWRKAAAALALLLAASAQAQAQAGANGYPTLLQALNTLREQGCESGARPAAALRENSALSQAAARLADGSPLADAIKSAGYRAVRGAQISLHSTAGAPAISRTTLGATCPTALNGEMAEAGFHQRGNQTWVVLAAPFTPPDVARGADIQARLLALVNEARARPRRCGNDAFVAARPLRLNSTLHGIASVHAADMANHSYFSHAGRDGSHVDDRASHAGYRWRNIGENIAAGQMQAETAVQGWLASPGHCANIMSPAFSEMGAAFAVNNNSSLGIYWVQVLGTAR
jgi:uncharacterized protein YkwD